MNDSFEKQYNVKDIDRKLLKASIAAYGVYGPHYDKKDEKWDRFSTWETLKAFGGNPVGLTKATVYVAGVNWINACYLGETETEILLVFRATAVASFDGEIDGVIDWLCTDLKANPVADADFGEGQIHKGFRDAVISLMKAKGRINNENKKLDTTLYQDIVAAVKASPEKSFHIVGYSKGCGLSPLAATYLINKGEIEPSRIESVHIFEAPRCGDHYFVNYYNDILGKRTKRFEYQYDIVPHLPPLKDCINYLKERNIKTYDLLNDIYNHKLSTWHYQSVGNLIHINDKNRINQYRDEDLYFEMQNFEHLENLIKTDGKKALGETFARYHSPYGEACHDNEIVKYGIGSVLCADEKWPFPFSK